MNKFDIYDITTNTWSIGVLPANIYGSSVISVNNTIYIAGGYVNDVLSNQVWKLEF
jgi:N-acetylneuraminic acid mutarotase